MVQNVLFMCVENSCRSQIAEAFGKLYGAGIINAYSAGSNPSGTVNPKVIESLKEKGIDISESRSKGFDAYADVDFDYVIGMGCGDSCPFIKNAKNITWDIPDPKNLDMDQFCKIRDEIEDKVRDLIINIGSRKS